MAISSTSLFHYTNRDALQGILKAGFKITFSKEALILRKKNKGYLQEFAVPMVCFCDIPISLVQNHVSFYCPDNRIFALGMRREWAEKNGLNPVLYISEDSGIMALMKSINGSIVNFTTSELINKIAHKPDVQAFLTRYPHIQQSVDEEIADLEEKKKNEINAKFQSDAVIFSSRESRLALFIKPVKGRYLRWSQSESGYRVFHNYTYYNEREWRYIPHIVSEFSITSKLLTTSEIDDAVSIDSYRTELDNKLIPALTDEFKYLKFEASDISIIIVDTQSAVTELIELILSEEFTTLGGGSILDQSQKLELISKIISWETISQDVLG